MIMIYENRDITALNSFGVQACASRLVEWETAADLAGIFAQGLAGERWMVLAGGNNILFTRDYNGTLLHPVSDQIEETGEDSEKVFVRALAGVDWDAFTDWCAARGLWGAENLTGIPGTVGACPIQNIGAYGAEAKEIISSVECYSVETGNAVTLSAAHCDFGYRDSVFKRDLRGKAIITAVNFALWKAPRPNLTYSVLAEKLAGTDAPTIAGIRQAVTDIRNSKLPDPRVTGNAGSFFKNPIVDAETARKLADEHPDAPMWPTADGQTKLAAGWLIDQAGWKGASKGRVGIHARQALIVVNLGGAAGQEIIDFARAIQADVKEKFGVALETEVNII